MKKIPSILCAVFALMGLLALEPGCSVELYNADAAGIVWTLIMLAAVIALFVKRPKLGRFQRICCAVMPFLSILNLYIPLNGNSPLGFLLVFINGMMAVIVALWFVRPVWIKVIAAVLMIPVLAVLGMLAFFGIILYDFGATEIVRTIPSPDETMIAEVISIDEGALGGSTVVDVRGTLDVNLGFARLRSVPQRVYLGDWGEFEEMTVEWIDADTLMIDGVEYGIEE